MPSEFHRQLGQFPKGGFRRSETHYGELYTGTGARKLSLRRLSKVACLIYSRLVNTSSDFPK